MLVKFQQGQRVTATLWATKREGTVTAQRSAAIVWVLWDGADKATWVHADTLTLIAEV